MAGRAKLDKFALLKRPTLEPSEDRNAIPENTRTTTNNNPHPARAEPDITSGPPTHQHTRRQLIAHNTRTSSHSDSN
jgi:hypothetical protein